MRSDREEWPRGTTGLATATGERRPHLVDNYACAVDNAVTGAHPVLSPDRGSSQVVEPIKEWGGRFPLPVDNSGNAGDLGNKAAGRTGSGPLDHGGRTIDGAHLAGNLASPSPGQDSQAAHGRGGLFLHGTATDSTGSPVGGVVLTLTDANGRQIERARTDDEGGYRIDVAHGGTYVLIASAGHFQPTASMVVVADQPVRHDVRMYGAGALTGLVHAQDKPVMGATVVVTDVRGEVVATCATGSDGRYRFSNLVGGSYALTVTAEGCRPVATSIEIVDGEQAVVDVPLESGGKLGGAVRSAATGRPVADARVTLLDEEGSVVAVTTTGEDGTYTFTDLPDGQYTVIATGYPPVASSLRLDGEHAEHDVELGHREARG